MWSVVISAVLASAINFAECNNNYLSRNPDLNFIANIDGKSFYAEASGKDTKFAEALDFCHEHDLNLAEIESQPQNNRISNYGINHESALYWLGATDYFREGTFYWLKNNRIVTYNNFQNNNTLDFNCAFISSSNGTWFYDSCSNASHKILCETDSLRQDVPLVFV